MTTFISTIEYCEARHVHVWPNLPRHEVMQEDYAPWTKIATLNFADVQCSDDVDTQRRFDIRVTAMLPSRIVLPEAPMVFRLTDIYGVQYLLGVPRFCPPYPLATQQDHAAANPSDSCLCKLEIRQKSIFPLLKFV